MRRHRSHSAPGLGKGENPLRGYAGDSRATISPEELEAEALYYAVISSSITKPSFGIMAKDLTRRSSDAGAYLAWLITRGPEWPKVVAAVR